MKGSFKKLASLTLAGGMILSASAPAFAAGGTTDTSTATQTQSSTATNVQAGITPDSLFYFVDKLLENLQLTFTQNTEARAKLLADISNERKAELSDLVKKHNDGQISDSQWNKFSTEIMSNYKERLSQAIDELTKLKAQADAQTSTQGQNNTNQTNTQASNQTSTQNNNQASSQTNNQNTDSVNAIQTDIQSAANINTDELKGNDKAEKDAEEVKAAAAVVVKGYDQAKVQDLRKKGFGYGAIAHIFALSDASGKSIDKIVSLLSTDKGFGKLAKDLGLNPSMLGAGKHIQSQAKASSTNQDNTTSTSNDTQGTNQNTGSSQTSGDQTSSTQTTQNQSSTAKQDDQQRTTVNATVNVGKATVGASVNAKEHAKSRKSMKEHGKSTHEDEHSGKLEDQNNKHNGNTEDQKTQTNLLSNHDNEQGDQNNE